MSEGPRRGRPPRIGREDIAAAVLDVGFSELTFAAVRERLGVGESTLYRHAPDRDALVRIGLDRALAEISWPPLDAPWRQLLESYAHAAWHALAAHPGSATEIARGVVPPRMTGLFARVGTALMREGFTAEHAVLSGDLVFDLVTDNRRGIEQLDALVGAAGPGRAGVAEQWAAGEVADGAGGGEPEAASHAPETAELHTRVHAAIAAEPFAWFVAKLGVVLAGIDVTLAPPRGDTSKAGPDRA